MNPVIRVALHPVFILMAVLSFLSSTLPQYFHLPAGVAWGLGFGVALLTLVIAQMKAVHQDLAVPVSEGVFHLIITACTWASLIFQLLSTYLGQAAVSTTSFDGGAAGGVPFVVPLYVYGILAIGKGLADVIANQLHLSSADGEQDEGTVGPAVSNVVNMVPPEPVQPAVVPTVPAIPDGAPAGG